jgi:hypothetical protein
MEKSIERRGVGGVVKIMQASSRGMARSSRGSCRGVYCFINLTYNKDKYTFLTGSMLNY